MATKNLGTVQAISISSSPPTNLAMLWYNTGVNAYTQYKQYAYDLSTSSWKIVGKDSISTNLTNGTITYIVIGNKLLHKLITFRFILVRNGQIATGFVEVVNYSSSLQIAESSGRVVYGNNVEVGEDAISFTVAYSSNNIRLIATCSNTGHNATMDLFNIDQIT
jgi:hypothetical protein